MRKETWDIDLMDFIKSREKTTFCWGVQDCVLFAADCAQSMTGIDLADKYRGYTTEMGAALIMGRAGSLQKLVNLNIGPEISPKLARRGDWVLIEQNGVQTLAVCLGKKAMGVKKEKGLAMVPMSDAITAWRID
jgi:hypothetical protein